MALVFGASGYIGRHLVPRLAAEGYRVRAVARRRGALAAEGWQDVELATADALKPETLPDALRGASVVYYLVHSMAAGADFPDQDRRAAHNVARAAEAAGVERIVYLGGLTPAATDSAHLASRAETGALLRRAGTPVTELRAPIVIGPGSVAFEAMRDLAAHLPVMATPKWVRATSPPIALDDLLGDLIALPRVPEAAGEIYETGGPDTLTYEEMLRELARAMGKRAPLIVPVPVLTPELSSYWLAFVTTTPTRVARALIGGMKHDLSADDRPLRRLVPRQPMPFRQAVDRAFEQETQLTAADRWREGAFDLRGRRHDVGFYAKRMSRTGATSATPEALWQVLSEIGKPEQGYFVLQPLWRLRREADRLLGRRHPGPRTGDGAPEAGERFDSWEVLAAVPDRRLTLISRLAAPGEGGLEFEIVPARDGGARLTATIYWHPAGFRGLIYWYQLGPAHAVLLEGMAQRICELAEAKTVDMPDTGPDPDTPSGPAPA
jgi:uncharacterized protein YbjT (DUF2867 family)